MCTRKNHHPNLDGVLLFRKQITGHDVQNAVRRQCHTQKGPVIDQSIGSNRKQIFNCNSTFLSLTTKPFLKSYRIPSGWKSDVEPRTTDVETLCVLLCLVDLINQTERSFKPDETDEPTHYVYIHLGAPYIPAR